MKTRHRTLALAAILLSSSVAQAAEGPDVELGASTSYAWAGEYDGIGGAISASWLPLTFLAIGTLAEVTRLSSSGAPPNPYRHDLVSVFLGPMAQLRGQLGPLIPYLEVAVGYVVVDTVRAEGLRGRFGSGLGLEAAVGAKLIVADEFALGVRTAARNAAGEVACLLAADGTRCPSSAVLLSPAITADLRF